MQADGRLAVGLLAQGSAVLALHSDGVDARFGKGGVIEHEDPCRIGKTPGQEGAVATPHRPLLPGARTHELLQALVGVFGAGQSRRQAYPAAEGLDALALAVLEQPCQVHPAPGALTGMIEVGRKVGGVLLQAREHAGFQLRSKGAVHREARRYAHPCQNSNGVVLESRTERKRVAYTVAIA